MAVFILLSKYDDHLALYTLERIFRERHGVAIPRQQMVQWIEHVAGLLRLIVDRMWIRMRRGDYLQIDETPVRVLDPEIKGKAARGYLWFFALPRGDVILIFDRGRSHEAPKKALEGFQGLFQSDDFSAYETLVKKLPGVRRAGCAPPTPDAGSTRPPWRETARLSGSSDDFANCIGSRMKCGSTAPRNDRLCDRHRLRRSGPR